MVITVESETFYFHPLRIGGEGHNWKYCRHSGDIVDSKIWQSRDMKWKIHSRDIVDIVFWHSRGPKWKIHSRDIVKIVFWHSRD